MSYKDILVHLDGTGDSKARLRLAARLAADHQARLTGIFACESVGAEAMIPVSEPGYLSAEDLSSSVRQFEHSIEAASAANRAALEDAAWRHDISTDWQAVVPVPDFLFEAAFYSDLAVIGLPAEDAPVAAGADPGDVMLSSGRPTLVVPAGYANAEIGRNVLVAWKPGREAARAVSDALPILQQAENVTVVTVNPHDSAGASESEAKLVNHLQRHRVRAKTIISFAPDESAGEAILHEAAKLNADLIVMGAYGRTRMTELLLGGATRHVLDRADCPVLFSH